MLSLTEQELEQHRQRCTQLEQDRDQVAQEMEKCQKVRAPVYETPKEVNLCGMNV